MRGVPLRVYDIAEAGRRSELVRYIVFGVLNVVVTWFAYAIFVLVGISPVVSNALSWVVGVAVAFVCNKFWVFYSKSVERGTVEREALYFFFERIFTGVLAIVSFWLLYELGVDHSLFGVDGFFAKMITTAAEVALNFLISKYYVFRPQPRRPE